MFCETHRDRLIRAGDGPALSYQPCKDTDVPADSPFIPHLSPEDTLSTWGSSFWVLGSEVKHFTSPILQTGSQPGGPWGEVSGDNDPEALSLVQLTCVEGLLCTRHHSSCFRLHNLTHRHALRLPISETRGLRPCVGFPGVL